MRIITKDISKFDKKWWEKFYFLHHHTYNTDELEAFQAAVNEIGTKSVLDVGCGEGFFSTLAKGLYVGIDWSEEAIRQAKNNNPFHNFKTGSLDNITSYYDYALLSMVFEHLEDPKAYIDEIRTKARQIIVIIPNGEAGHVCVENDKELLAKDFEDLDYHYATYTKKDILDMYPDGKLLCENGTTLTFLI